MLMLHFHAIVSLELIALAFGAAILIWSKVHENVGTSLAKIIGYVIIIVAVINMLCTGYYAIKYWQEGYFDKPSPMMMQNQKMGGQMMSGKSMPMMPCPMMSGQMMKDQGMQNKMMPMPMNDQMGTTKQMSNSMMQNQMNNAPMPQGTTIETQKPLSNNPEEHATHHQ